MSARDFAELLAYYRINPWGPERGDYQSANVAHAVACSVWSGKGRRPRFKDYVLRFKTPRAVHRDAEHEEPRAQKLEDMQAIVNAFIADCEARKKQQV